MLKGLWQTLHSQSSKGAKGVAFRLLQNTQTGPSEATHGLKSAEKITRSHPLSLRRPLDMLDYSLLY